MKTLWGTLNNIYLSSNGKPKTKSSICAILSLKCPLKRFNMTMSNSRKKMLVKTKLKILQAKNISAVIQK